MKYTKIAVALLALTTGAAARAQAQSAVENDGYITFEIGAQPHQRTVESSTSFPLYDETATVTTSQLVHNGPVFGIGGGYKLRPSIGVGALVTVFGAREGTASVTASIPDIAFFNQPKTVTASGDGFKHGELGIHLHAIWFGKAFDKFPVTLSAGPSIVNVKHDVPTATVSSGTQTVTVGKTTEKKTGFGVNVGGTGEYPFTDAISLAVFVRYAAAKVDLPSVPDLSVGGLQLGVGVRYGF